MKKAIFKVKHVVIALFTLMFMACALLSLSLMKAPKMASASTETDFSVVGMSIRTGTPEGLRFVVKVSDSVKDDNAKYGVMIVPESLLDGELTIADTTADTLTSNETDAVVVMRGEWWGEELCEENGIEAGYSVYSCAIVGNDEFPTALYNTPMVAVGFAISESGVAYTASATRSISYVAVVESLKDAYVENAVVEKFVTGAEVALSVNGGETITSTEGIAPVLTVAGMPYDTSSAVSVEYTSDNEEVAKILEGKVVAVSSGSAKITATISVNGGQKTIQTTEEISCSVEKRVVLNNAEIINGWFESNATTMELSTDHVVEGTHSAKLDFAGWGYLNIYYRNADTSLADISQFEYIEMTIYSTAVSHLYYSDQATSARLLAVGENLLRLNVANMVNAGFVTETAGVQTFWMGGTNIVYIDNVVGKLPTPSEENVLNSCDTAISGEGITATTTTEYAVSGNALKVTSTGNWANFRILMYENGSPMTVAQLQEKYSKITFQVTVETAGTRMSTATDEFEYGGAAGVYTFEVDTTKLTNVSGGGMANYVDGQGLFLQIYSSGCTIYLDNFVGVPKA